jgi:thimet oligopeptidase
MSRSRWAALGAAAIMTLQTGGAVAAERVTLPILDAVTLKASCTQMLAEARARVAELEQLPLDQATPERVLDRWDADAIALEDIIGPVAILNNVHPDKPVRDAADACVLDLSRFQVEVFQNEALFERVRAVEPRTPAEEQLKKDLVEAFEDTGAALPPEKRERAKAIADRLTSLNQEFERNIRENPERLTFGPDEYEGLPASYLQRVPRDDKGNIVVGFDYPDFNPFMANARNEAARRRYYIAYMNRGTPRNVEVLEEIVALRKELASLYGMPSYAHFALRRRMADTPEAVISFLNDVQSAVSEVERRDVEELRRLKAEMTGTPLDKTVLGRWDISFYSERLREKRYQIDQEALRKYFPMPQTLDWLMHVSSRLFGVTFERAAVPVWHEDVLYYDVRDGDTKTFLGGIYLDLYPREGKFTHAAAWPVRGVSRKVGRTPITVLVTNFDRKGLTHDEAETFFHEFGHVLHGVLSETEYNAHAGTSVQRDFVEAPSQIFEEWTRRLDSLSTIREVCGDCPVMDEALVKRLNDARRFGQGIQYARQHLYAAFDMALYGSAPGRAMDVWQEMEGKTTLGYVPGTQFPGTFAHIAGGYAAAYYGYMWAEVLALDMLSAFGENLMDPEVGRRFRREILSRGGEEPARVLVERFLGRPVSRDAFVAEITGTR